MYRMYRVAAYLDFLHPVEDVEHLLEDPLQVECHLEAHAASSQQLQQVLPQSQHVVLAETTQVQLLYNVYLLNSATLSMLKQHRYNYFITFIYLTVPCCPCWNNIITTTLVTFIYFRYNYFSNIYFLTVPHCPCWNNTVTTTLVTFIHLTVPSKHFINLCIGVGNTFMKKKYSKDYFLLKSRHFVLTEIYISQY